MTNPNSDAFTKARMRWLEQVNADGELSLSAYPVAGCLALKYISRSGFEKSGTLTAWPSLPTICEATGRSQKSTRNGIIALVARGHIQREIGDGGTSSRYHLLVVNSEAAGGDKNGTPAQKGTPAIYGTGGVPKREKGVPKREPEPFEEPYEEPIEGKPSDSGGRDQLPWIDTGSINAATGQIIEPAEALFGDFWSLYPPTRYGSKIKASMAFENEVKKGADPSVLILAAGNYHRFRRNSGQTGEEFFKFTKNPQAWLSEGLWRNFLAEPSAAAIQEVSDPFEEYALRKAGACSP